MLDKKHPFVNAIVKRDIKYVYADYYEWEVEKEIVDHNLEKGILPFDLEYDQLDIDVYKKAFVRCSVIPKKTLSIAFQDNGEFIQKIGDETDVYQLACETWSNPKKGVSRSKIYNPITQQLIRYEQYGNDCLYIVTYQTDIPYSLESRYFVRLSTGKFIHNFYTPEFKSKNGMLPNIAHEFNKDGHKRRVNNWNIMQEYVYQNRAIRL